MTFLFAEDSEHYLHELVGAPSDARAAPAASHAPRPPAIVRGTPPHSARRWRAPAPFGPLASGGGRRAPHPATEPGSRLPASGPQSAPLPAGTASADDGSPPSRAVAPRHAQPPRCPRGRRRHPAKPPTRPRDPPPPFQSAPRSPPLPPQAASPAPKPAGDDFSPIMFIVGGQTAKRGRTATFRFQLRRLRSRGRPGDMAGGPRADAPRILSPAPTHSPPRDALPPGTDAPTRAEGCAGPTVAG